MPAPWELGAQVRIVGAMHGSETNNVLNFATNTVGFDDPTFARDKLIELGNHILACIRDTFLGAVTQDWQLVRVEARPIFPAFGDPIIVTGTPIDVGELPAASHSFAATLVNVRSGVGGRRGRGRWFLPPPGEPQVTASDIDEPTMVALALFLTCLAEKFMGANPTTIWRLGVLSRTDAGPTLANFNVGFREAQSLNPVQRVAIISSRKKGVGA